MKSINLYRNNKQAIKYGELGWQPAQDSGLLNIEFKHIGNNILEDQHGHHFINMISCSYLGLDVDPSILQGAIDGITQTKTLIIGSSRLRIYPSILHEAEMALANQFKAPILTNISCGITSCGILPLVTSGHITGTDSLTLVFDKHAHFTMHIAKPICADEGIVLTSPHNDLNYLEDVCKKYPRVGYVCDGIYSMGDKAPVKELLQLQDKYGLFLYFDDSHGLSVYGRDGEGYVKSIIGELNPRTMIVASMWKGMGARGSLLMFGAEDKREIIKRYGGGIAWSQYLTSADCGAIIASIAIHQTPRLKELQDALQHKIQLLDSLLPSSQAGNDFPIRVLRFGDEATSVKRSKMLYDAGFYASAVCFPVVERGKAGLRVMMRSNLQDDDIRRLADLINQISHDDNPELSKHQKAA